MSENEREQLQTIIKKGSDWRERERAQTIVMLSLMTAKLWQSVNGLWFLGFLMALIERISKPLVVILDNASIHTAKKLSPYWELLAEESMRFYFLPPYSPELNRIELLWRKMKYEWLPFQDI